MPAQRRSLSRIPATGFLDDPFVLGERLYQEEEP